MKKLICILFSLTVLITSTFADKSRFYEDGKVIDTMYVDSKDGLRVRDYPSLKSNKICSLTHRLPVKVVAVGKEETIDGITAPWVEILIPRYEWKGDEAEFGWVFGEYLKEKKSEFKKPSTKEELKKYLTSYFYWVELSESRWKETEDYFRLSWYHDIYTCFSQNNYYKSCDAKAYGDGTFKVIDSETLEFHCKSYDYEGDYDNSYYDSTPSEIITKVKIEVLTENSFSIKYLDYDYEMICNAFTFYGRELNMESPCLYMTDFTGLDKYSELEMVARDDDTITEKYGSKKSLNTDYICNAYYEHEVSIAQTAEDLIKTGVSAAGTEYEQQYHDYWNPIMAEHQKKADAMK
ncbi:MAG: SH3 domain-containing protein [Treponema sp.]|nr:SH3 domain-containing protein [Treponema sp.]